jgi:uncharacterized protein (DUF983 family)
MAETGGTLNFLLKALMCRCPRCGEESAFAGYLRFKQVCGHCGLQLAKHDNGDGPAVFVIFILGFICVPIALVIAMKTDWPLWVHGALWSGIVVVATLALLRPAKSLTVALQYRYRASAFE